MGSGDRGGGGGWVGGYGGSILVAHPVPGSGGGLARCRA